MDLYEHWTHNYRYPENWPTEGATPADRAVHMLIMAGLHEGPPKPTEKFSSDQLRRKGVVGLYRKPWSSQPASESTIG